MKLVTFDDGRSAASTATPSCELDVRVHPRVLRARRRRSETGRRFALADVRLRAPIVPKKFFHTAGNFTEHHTELAGGELVAPRAQGNRVLPERRRDHRARRGRSSTPRASPGNWTTSWNSAIVIGRAGKFFSPEQAADHIAGYLVFNDITARDIQRREMQSGVFSFSKSIDTFCPIGPWIVTDGRDPRPAVARMELRVNGDVRQRGNTAQMVISIPHLVAYHSAQGYSAGDIITTGTISGVAAVQPNPFDFYLRPGDRIEAEIEGVGVLRNHVVPWSAAHDTPPYTTDLYSSTVGSMRFGTVGGRFVLVRDGRALDVATASGGALPSDVAAALARSTRCARGRTPPTGRRRPPSPTRTSGPPVPHPRQVFAIALNYRPHAAEAGFVPPDEPLVFTKFPTCVTGPVSTVRLPPGTVDWEIEVVAVVGAGGHRDPRSRAWDAVAGLTCGQDLSERVMQMRGTPPQFSLAKSLPGSARSARSRSRPDEFADPADVAFESTLIGADGAGETVQAGTDGHDLPRRPPGGAPLARCARCCRATSSSPARRPASATARDAAALPPPRRDLVSRAEGIGELRTRFRVRSLD